jgi:Domain of unknown function (DUF4091)
MLFAQPQFAVRKSLQVSRNISSGAILDWGVRKMKVIIQLRATARALSITSLHLFLIFFLCLSLPALASAQDPLAPGNMPAIDTNPADYPSNIWMTDTMTKVRQDAGSPGTTHWGTFYGTQNEFVDFQVHVQAGSGGISNLSVTASDFVNAKTGTTISASSTRIIVYREAYINVSPIVSAVSSTFYGSTGYYPDILIPAVDPYFHQTTNAWPFTVAANHNQSAWIDVLIPSNAPSGYYSGSVTVKSGSSTLTTMPVIIGVWQWPASHGGEMPSTTTLKNVGPSLGYNGMCINLYQGDASTTNTGVCSGYPDSGGGADGAITRIQLDAGLLMNDHRYTDSAASINIYPQSGSFSNFVSLMGPQMNGTGCNHGGTVCGVLSGAKSTSQKVSYYNGASAATFNNWQANFNSNGWGPTLFDYLCDEPPNGCSWSTLVSNGAARHAYNSPPIPELVTASIANATANGALNSIDWLVTVINQLDPLNGSLLRSSYDSWLASPGPGGVARRLLAYEACDSGGSCANGIVGNSTATWPNYFIDGKPAANRAMEWLSYRNGVSGELYYASDICMSPSGGQGQNCGYPTHPMTPFTNVYYSGGWGDGTLLYAGCAGSLCIGKPSYMGSSVTVPIILPSVRLKHIRDGQQDYEYLHVLANAGKGSLVTTQLNSWITNSHSFETSGAGLQAARSALGSALHQLTYSSSLMPPPSLSGTLQ